MKQAIYTLVFITLFSSAASVSSYYFASGYTELHSGDMQQAAKDKITSESDTDTLKDMALFIHHSYTTALKDHASMYISLTKIFALIAFLCAIALFAAYKHNASNKSLNTEAGKRRAR